MIPFNAPYITGNEIKFIEDAINSGKLSGDGYFTKKCQSYFESNFGFKKTFLTSSCTDALEMSAMLLNANPMDEIILPSYTYVTSALAFLRQGLKIIFSDSLDDNPNIDPKKIEPLITEKTKAILVVHYAGVACDMEKIMTIAQKHNLIVIEDCAQAISSYYGEKPLGTFGQLSCFSFHETKNIISGEGGLLAVNDQKLISRAEKIWEKGTNRSQFLKGIINKYEWVDIGSSFLPSELTAAFLWAQLQSLHQIQEKRLENWNYYFFHLRNWANKNNIQVMTVPSFAKTNGHMFYLICESIQQRTNIIEHLKEFDISSVSHYLSLHSSPFYKNKHDGRPLRNSDKFTDRLLRLPMYYNLDVEKVVNSLIKFDNNDKNEID